MGGERFEMVDRAGAVEAIGHMGEEDLRFLNRLNSLQKGTGP